MNKIFTIAALIMLIASTTFGAETRSSLFRSGNMKSLSKASKNERKPMMVYVGGSYCGQSQKMNEVFKRNEVVNYMNENFVCKSFNAGNVFKQLKAASWGVTAIPSYVFINAKGKVIHVASGYRKPEKLIEEGNTALDKMRDQNNRPGSY